MPDPQEDASRPDWAPHVHERLSSSLRLSPTREREIVDELSQHLDDRWRELVSGGASPEAAETLALAEFRDRDTLARFLAPLRQAQTPPAIVPGGPNGSWPGDAWRDIQYAVRMLRRRPTFALVAMATIAIAIGANTAMFSVVRAALLAPLEFADADQLAGLAHAARTLLFGISPFDASTYLVLGGALLLITATATYLPARRAATVDPLVTLRS